MCSVLLIGALFVRARGAIERDWRVEHLVADDTRLVRRPGYRVRLGFGGRVGHLLLALEGDTLLAIFIALAAEIVCLERGVTAAWLVAVQGDRCGNAKARGGADVHFSR